MSELGYETIIINYEQRSICMSVYFYVLRSKKIVLTVGPGPSNSEICLCKKFRIRDEIQNLFHQQDFPNVKTVCYGLRVQLSLLV